MSVTPIPIARRERVSSFESLDGAARAVNHLVELRYDPSDVAIAPKDFEVVTDGGLSRRLASGLRVGAIIGAIVVGMIAVVRAIGIDALAQRVLPTVALAMVSGALAGLVVAGIRYRYVEAMSLDLRRPELAPTSFDIVVTRQPDRASHDLARWWDPAAPTVPR